LHKLSILIATIKGREEKLSSLLSNIKKQIKNKPVECLVLKDNKELETGRKRNLLVERSTGRYCVFVDDDDRISENYVDIILAKIEEGHPDAIGIVMDKNGKRMPLKSVREDELTGYLNHLCPMKREIFEKIRFKNVSKGEDTDFTNRLFLSEEIKHCDNSIDSSIYFYDYEDVDKEYDIKNHANVYNLVIPDDELEDYIYNTERNYTMAEKRYVIFEVEGFNKALTELSNLVGKDSLIFKGFTGMLDSCMKLPEPSPEESVSVEKISGEEDPS
jgi:glycosyltransferase involved in cell wall biosynthesis